MTAVWVPRDQIEDGSLPSVCVVCGDDASYRRFPGVSVPSAGWMLFSLIGLLTFWIYILFVGGSSRKGGLPFCERHRSYWTRRAWFIVGGFITTIGLIAVAVVVTPPILPGRDVQAHWMFGIVGFWMVLFLPAFLVVHLTATRPVGGTHKALLLWGASREFATAVEASFAED